jgi:hypothetical protein
MIYVPEKVDRPADHRCIERTGEPWATSGMQCIPRPEPLAEVVAAPEAAAGGELFLGRHAQHKRVLHHQPPLDAR